MVIEVVKKNIYNNNFWHGRSRTAMMALKFRALLWHPYRCCVATCLGFCEITSTLCATVTFFASLSNWKTSWEARGASWWCHHSNDSCVLLLLFFFFPRVVAATTNLLTVIFLIMCGNVPILVGSGIGILLHVIRLRSGGYIFVLCAQRLNKLLLLAR